jgi:glycosyltransferase involved in cell wall biosynthesis
MKRVLVNAVSAKHGGARTIVESFISNAPEFENLQFIVLAGFVPDEAVTDNVSWHYYPKSGVFAMIFTLFSVILFYLRYRCERIISFNNVNCVLLPSRRRITYFHQLKALDLSFTEAKLRIMRAYLRCSRDILIVQSNEVKGALTRTFNLRSQEILVGWPGVEVPIPKHSIERQNRRILIPITDPESKHKNFKFITELAEALGTDWEFIVTAPKKYSYLKPANANINFVGVLSQNLLFEEYRRASLCIISSTHETVGLPIFEALAVDTPVIAYNAGYIEYFQNHFGITSGLVLVDTPKDAIEYIVSNTWIYHKSVESKFDFTDSEWRTIITQALKPE